MAKTIVYILSTPYAGSHFLSLLLGSNSRAMHLGEVYHLRLPREIRGKECTLTRGEILKGIGPHNVDQVYDIVSSRIDPKIEVLIDNSKRVYWAERFLKTDTYHRKYIHLIRDPRALVRRYALHSHFRKRLRRRWRLFKAFPELRPRAFFIDEPHVWLYFWLLQNLTITRFLQQHGLECTHVTYRDLARNSAGEVQRLMQWIGLEYEPEQLEYWNFEHIGTQKREYEWVKEKKSTFIDLRWQTEIPPDVQTAIVNDQLVNDYLGKLHIAFADDGLTHLDRAVAQRPGRHADCGKH